MVQAETRRLAAIMFTDIVGFSRQMGADEARMLRLLEIHNQMVRQAVAERHGTVIKTVGDAFLVDFPVVIHAACASAGGVPDDSNSARLISAIIAPSIVISPVRKSDCVAFPTFGTF